MLLLQPGEGSLTLFSSLSSLMGADSDAAPDGVFTLLDFVSRICEMPVEDSVLLSFLTFVLPRSDGLS
jgi:hypothetical protein